jgi:hypothetical protein
MLEVAMEKCKEFPLRKACCLSVLSRSLFLPQIETADFEIQVTEE